MCIGRRQILSIPPQQGWNEESKFFPIHIYWEWKEFTLSRCGLEIICFIHSIPAEEGDGKNLPLRG